MKKLTKFLISIILTIILLYLILTQVKVNDVTTTIKNANFKFLGLSVIFYIIMMVLRALRFEVLLKKRIAFNKLLPIVFVHSLLTNIIPFRVGDLSYVVMLKKIKKQSYSKGLSSLLIARVFEFCVMIFILILAIIYSKDLPNLGFQNIIPLMIVVLVLLVLMIFSMIFLHDFLVRIFDRFLVLFPMLKLKLNKFLVSFKAYRSRKVLIQTFVLSVLTYISGVIFTYYIVIALNYAIPLNILLITITFSILSSILPINSVAGFGTVEGVWALILGYFGYTIESAILLSFSLHIIQLLFSGALGLLGWLLLPTKHYNQNI